MQRFQSWLPRTMFTSPSFQGVLPLFVVYCLTALLLLAIPCLAAPPAAPPPPGGMPDSEQSRVTSLIREIAQSIIETSGPAPLDRIAAAMRHVGESLAYDPWHNRDQFSRTADTLFRERTLGGCSEYALAQLTLIKALGYPARLTLSMNSLWHDRVSGNPLATPNGHSFVEVWTGGAWVLVDPTYFNIYAPYVPGEGFLPGNEIFMIRGGDFWTLGIRSPEDANALLREKSGTFKGRYADPSIPLRKAVSLDFPAAFTAQGKLFLDLGNLRLAGRFLEKALLLAPDNARAHAYKALYLRKKGATFQSAAEIDKAMLLGPGDPEVQAVADILRR